MNSEERKLEAWKLWVITQGVGVNDSEATLKNSPAGKVFSNAWDAAMVYAKSRLEDFVQDVWSKRVAPEGSVHDLAIYHAPFDVRSYNCLRAEDIKTIGELLRYTENDLLKIPNMGRKSAKSIIEVLDSMGLKLKDRPPTASKRKKNRDTFTAYSNECRVRRLGIYNQYKHEDKTVGELADLYGVTPGRIHQIIKRAEREINRKNDALPSIESIKADAMNHPPPPWLKEDQVNESNPD
jgi:predicted DNA-binding protein YlxM (UPF0122 family)